MECVFPGTGYCQRDCEAQPRQRPSVNGIGRPGIRGSTMRLRFKKGTELRDSFGGCVVAEQLSRFQHPDNFFFPSLKVPNGLKLRNSQLNEVSICVWLRRVLGDADRCN